MKFRNVGLALLLGTVAIPAAMAQNAPAPTPLAPQVVPAQLSYTQVLLPDAMRHVQERLLALGAFTGAADGNWGSDSQTALERFQQNSGLQVTGQLNQATAVTLGLNPADLVIARPVPPPAPVAATPPPPPPDAPHAPFALSTDSVRLVQSRLHQLGFYSGYVDGTWGGGTQSAMQAFQRSRGLPVTDGLNAPTVTGMGLDPTSMTPR